MAICNKFLRDSKILVKNRDVRYRKRTSIPFLFFFFFGKLAAQSDLIFPKYLQF